MTLREQMKGYMTLEKVPETETPPLHRWVFEGLRVNRTSKRRICDTNKCHIFDIGVAQSVFFG